MKKLIAVLIAALVFWGCTKQASPNLRPERMNGVEFTKKYGIELPFLDYSTEEVTAKGGNSAAKKPKANAVTLAVWSNDLTLTESGGVLTTSLSPDAEWGGVQRFWTVDTVNFQTSVCNWNWSWSVAPATQTCNTVGFGNYRSWTSDKVTYDIHVSPFLEIE